MYINDKKLSQLLQSKGDSKKNNIKVFFFDFSQTVTMNLTVTWVNIEYLSLRNNYLKEVSFLQYFPMLFYLDLIGNPIEDFELFNKHNTFAYLGLTAPQNFLEKNILLIKGMIIGILNFEIRNEAFKEQFIKNNPNVFYFNGYCHTFQEKMALINKRDCIISLNSSCSNKISPIKVCLDMASLDHTTKAKSLSPTQTITYSINSNKTNVNSIRERFIVIINDNPNAHSPFVKELISFTEEYNKTMLNCLTTENNESSLEISKVKLQQKEEKKRLLMLSLIYKRIAQFRNMLRNTIVYHTEIKRSQNSKGTLYENINFTLYKLHSIPMQLLVLSIIYLYIIGIFSKQICVEIFHSFHIQYNTQQLGGGIEFGNESSSLREEVQRFFNVEFFYIICFYFDIYESFSALYQELKASEIKNQKNKIDHGIIQYNGLRKSLKMLQLTMIIPQLELHHQSTCDLNKMREAGPRNEAIQSLIIAFLLQENIYKETLQIVQFVNDFLLFNKYESILVTNLSNDYRLFHEIKEQLYKNIGNARDAYSLSEKKYNQIKLLTLANKYFFKTKQYNQFTYMGSQLNRFFIIPKPTFYPIKPSPTNTNRNGYGNSSSINDTEENDIKISLKRSKELQNSLSIQSERNKNVIKNKKKIILTQAKLFQKNIIGDQLHKDQKSQSKEPISSKRFDSPIRVIEIKENSTSQRGARLLIHENQVTSPLFHYKEMKKRKSQSVTRLFSKAKKLPKFQLKPLRPIYINKNSGSSSHRRLNKLSIDTLNKISFRLKANQNQDQNQDPKIKCLSNRNTIDSIVVLESKCE